MPAKHKKGRGKTVNINEFNEDYIPEEALDWAAQDLMTPEQMGEAKLAEKIEKQRREFSRTANNKLTEAESFRTAEASSNKYSSKDLKPPFVAHFGNLRNGTTEEDFLSLFNAETIATHRLISQDGKSFAFVEFKSPHALMVALGMDQTSQRGRRMYVDLATPQQVERLLNRHTGEKPGMSRDLAGQQQPGGLASMGLSRDVFGGQQPEEQPGMPMAGSRSNFGSRVDLHSLNDLSRDMLGSAVQQAPASAASPLSIASWRDASPEQQPDFATLRDNRRSEENFDRRAGNMRPVSAMVSPVFPAAPVEPRSNPFSAEMGNWRDAPRAEAPKIGEVPAVPAEGVAESAPMERKMEMNTTSSISNALSSPNSRGGGRGGTGGPGRGGRGGRGGNAMFGADRGDFGVERSTFSKPAAPFDSNKWAELRRN